MGDDARMSADDLASDKIEFDDWSAVVDSFIERGWTDGLPIVPPTPGLVAACLEASGRRASDILGTEPTKGRVITAEKAAANAVMAGCKPEYFRAVATAVEAMCEPEFNLHAVSASTQGSAVLAVVNGPIAAELGINSGVSAFGPGHRANAAIGRALRLIIINATGSQSGEIDKATLGHPGKYTWCIAEAEDVSPWGPLQTDRGFSADDNTITVFPALSPIQVDNHAFQKPEEILVSFRDAMFAGGSGWNQGEVVIVLCPEHVGNIERAGWSKERVKGFLYETAARPVSEWRAAGRLVPDSAGAPADAVHAARSADGITVIVAGGLAGAFSCVIPLWSGGVGARSVTRQIQ